MTTVSALPPTPTPTRSSGNGKKAAEGGEDFAALLAGLSTPAGATTPEGGTPGGAPLVVDLAQLDLTSITSGETPAAVAGQPLVTMPAALVAATTPAAAPAVPASVAGVAGTTQLPVVADQVATPVTPATAVVAEDAPAPVAPVTPPAPGANAATTPAPGAVAAPTSAPTSAQVQVQQTAASITVPPATEAAPTSPTAPASSAPPATPTTPATPATPATPVATPGVPAPSSLETAATEVVAADAAADTVEAVTEAEPHAEPDTEAAAGPRAADAVRPTTGTPTPATASADAAAPAPVSDSRAVTAPAAPAAPPAPAPAATPAAQVAQLLGPTLASPDGTYTMSLQLYPEELGAVHVEVSLRGGEISLALHAADDVAKEVLRASLAELREQLEATGLTAMDVSVDSGGREQRDDEESSTAGAAGGSSTGDADGSAPALTTDPDAALDVRI